MRVRKKYRAESLKQRIDELQGDGDLLRQLLDEQFTAAVLVGMPKTASCIDTSKNVPM